MTDKYLSNFKEFKDQVILNFGVNLYDDLDHSFINSFHKKTFPCFDRKTTYPILLFDKYRKEFNISAFYIDPLRDNVTLSDNFYLRCWAPFAHLLMDQGAKAGEIYWVRAVKSYAEKYDFHCALSFVRRLWKHRWINSYKFCGELIIYCKAGIAKSEGLSSLDDYWLDEAYDLRQKINCIRDSVKNLDEWFEKLFVIIPEVIATLGTLNSLSEEGNKYFRLFSEIKADIRATRIVISISIDHNMSHPMSKMHLPLSYSTLKNRDNMGKILNAAKTDLLHKYKGRTIIPKFWYDLAINNLQTQKKDLPIELDEYSVRSFKAASYFTNFSL